jgi:hypothetical protein
MHPDICIYHGACADGFTAAWAVRSRYGDGVQYVPGFYGKEPPDMNSKNVVMVDFSYKRPVLDGLLQSGDVKQAMTILILDHHKTAAADLAGIKAPEGSYDARRWRAGWEQEMDWPVRAVFDMDRSGAQIAWDYFHPDKSRPKLVDYVADRDLWLFNLPKSREVAALIFSYPYDFDRWDWLAEKMETDFDTLAAEGAAIERKHFKDIDELLAQTTREMIIGGQRVKVANLPYTMSSDAAGKLADGAPFGACYFDRADARVFSLRSRGDAGADVSEIAARYGGGGNRNAAGFQMPIGWEGDPAI